MGKPAARVGDMHTCPASDGPKPHVGGALPPGVPTVLIGGPSAILPPGGLTVLIGGRPAARVGDPTAHGGTVTGPGCPTVLIGP